jgi:hypothetical protein
MALLPLPPEAKPPYWNAWRADLRNRVLAENPLNFTGFPSVYHTMLTDHWPSQMAVEFDALPVHYKVIATSVNYGIFHDNGRISSFGRNMIHQAYHIHRFETVTGLAVKDMQSIIEFGGGYGAMAHLVHQLGFTGDYTIVDLPEFSLLQEYYLSNVEDAPPVNFIDSQRNPAYQADMLIACYSLSECDADTRYRFLAGTAFQHHLFLYSDQWEDYNNQTYFRDYFPRMYPHIHLHHEAILHLPPASSYTFGWTDARKPF